MLQLIKERKNVLHWTEFEPIFFFLCLVQDKDLARKKILLFVNHSTPKGDSMNYYIIKHTPFCFQYPMFHFPLRAVCTGCYVVCSGFKHCSLRCRFNLWTLKVYFIRLELLMLEMILTWMRAECLGPIFLHAGFINF